MRKLVLYSGVLLLLPLALALPVLASTGLQEVDLANYLELVNENNLDLRVAQIQLVQAEIIYQRATAANLAVGSRQAAKRAVSDWNQAQASFEENRSAIMQEAVSRYFAVILAEMDLRVRERRLGLAKARREITDRKVAQGVVGEMEVFQAVRDLERAKLDSERASQTFDEKVLTFNAYAGTSEITYIPNDPPIYPIVKYASEEAATKARAASTRLRRLRELVEIAKLDLAKSEAEGTAELVVKSAQNDLALAELEVQRAEEQLSATVLGDLHALKSLEKQIALSQLDLEIQQAAYNTTEKQYEAGLLTGRDLDEAAANLWDSQKAVLQAQQSYALKLLSFRELLGEELE